MKGIWRRLLVILNFQGTRTGSRNDKTRSLRLIGVLSWLSWLWPGVRLIDFLSAL